MHRNSCLLVANTLLSGSLPIGIWELGSFMEQFDDVVSGLEPAADQSSELLIGESVGIRSLKEIAKGISPRRSTVMILGETGSGKEMFARFIHQNSRRASKPFIPVDCSSLSD